MRNAANKLTPSITSLVNKSLHDGTVPALWKVAHVTPLHKTDDKLLVENYRPISVLPALSKVMERVVHTQLSIHLDQPGYDLTNISMDSGVARALNRLSLN